MANKQVVVGVKREDGKFDHTTWEEGDTLVDGDGNPIGGGGGGEWLGPGASDDLTPNAQNPGPFRPIFIAWESLTPYPLGVPPNPICYERTANGILLGGDGSVEGFGWNWPNRNDGPALATKVGTLFDVAVDVEEYATEYNGTTLVYWPYLALMTHRSWKPDYASSIILFAPPTSAVSPKVQGVVGYITKDNDPHDGIGFVDLVAQNLTKISLRIKCETLWDDYYKRFCRVWRLGYLHSGVSDWQLMSAVVEVPLFTPPTPSSTRVQVRNGTTYEVSSNMFGDINQAVPNPQDVSHLWGQIQFGVSGIPEDAPLNGAAYFKNFRWETSDWDYTIPNPA